VVVVLLLAVTMWWAGQRTMLFGLLWLLVTPLLFVFFSGPTDRYFYLPSMGYSILVAAFFTGVLRLMSRWRLPVPHSVARIAVAAVLGALLLSQAVELVGKAYAWKVAGQATGGVFHDVKQLVPAPEDGALFYFIKLPAFMDGVPAFQNALPQAIQLVYGNNTLHAVATECAELQGAPSGQEKHFLTFKGDGVREFSGEEDCR
jgi:hypothetical protein